MPYLPIRGANHVYKRTSIDRLHAHARSQARSRLHLLRDDIVLYNAYGAAGRALLEGRVIDYQMERIASVADRRLSNLRRSLRLMFNEERRHMAVRAWMTNREWTTVTDEEGYFQIDMHNLAAIPSGWHRIHAAAGDATDEIGLLLVPPENAHGVISDVDDTILITQVSSKRLMLINTFLRNPTQREVVPGIAAAYRALLAKNPMPAAAPMFYLSATPRQLHLPLQAILDRNGMPPGVLITKLITNDATSEPLLDQLAYKTAKIEQILARVPHARFTLIGDDAERDPEVFAAIRDRHPSRIDAIWIRRVHPDPERPRLPGQGNLTDLLR
jgi:phosphatidate phosphatase APP1